MTRTRLACCLALLLASGVAVAQEIPQESIHAGSSVSRFFHAVRRAPRAVANGVRKTGRAIGRGAAAVGRGVSRPFHHSGPSFETAEFPNDPYGGVPSVGTAPIAPSSAPSH